MEAWLYFVVAFFLLAVVALFLSIPMAVIANRVRKGAWVAIVLFGPLGPVFESREIRKAVLKFWIGQLVIVACALGCLVLSVQLAGAR